MYQQQKNNKKKNLAAILPVQQVSSEELFTETPGVYEEYKAVSRERLEHEHPQTEV